MDFRRRALLQHYWVTRDLTAIARFGGYKRPESALNLISEILSDQGVDSIDKLATLPEFEALKGDRKRLASVGKEDQLTITIQLDRDEMDIIRNSGLTPTQAVKTIISLKDLYGAFMPGGISAVTTPSGGPAISSPMIVAPTPSSGPTAAPSLGSAPAGPPVGSGSAAPPSLDKSPSLDKAPISTAPALSPTPAKSPGGPGAGSPDPGGPGPGGQLNELKQILAARRAKIAKQEREGEEGKPDAVPAKPGGFGGEIRDIEPKVEDTSDDEDEDIPDLPDFSE